MCKTLASSNTPPIHSSSISIYINHNDKNKQIAQRKIILSTFEKVHNITDSIYVCIYNIKYLIVKMIYYLNSNNL